MEFKWLAIMVVGVTLCGSIAAGLSAMAESNSVSACASAGMEWRNGDCLKAADAPR